MNSIKRLYAIIPKNWSLFFRGVAQYGLWALAIVFNAHMLGLITSAIDAGDSAIIFNLLYVYGGVLIVLHILIYATRNRGWTELMNGYQKVVHDSYVKQFVYLDNDAVERTGTGKIISIMERGMELRGAFISESLARGTSLLISLVYVSYLFSTLGVWYLLGFVVFMVVMCVCAYYFNQKMLQARRGRVYAKNRYSKQLIRIIMSKVEVMQHRNHLLEMKKLDAPMDDAIIANKAMNPYIHRFFYLPALILDFGRIVLFGSIALLILQGNASIGLLVSLGVGIVYLDNVLRQTLMFYKDVTKQFDVVKRMREFIDESAPKRDYNQGADFVYSGSSILFDHVSFAYKAEPVFTDFSLTIAGSKKTALVGMSGSGKSTLVKLIAGYLMPDGGNIYVDTQDLQKVKLTNYWKHIGFLTQEPNVFDGTIYENLTYALHDTDTQNTIDEVSLHQALHHAQCDFVFDLEDGIYTEIGERGIRLSGGQRQRLAIAKIFLKNPSIVILDEPTSALDSFSEEAITEAMHNLFENRTVIIIAHRLQTVKNADDIIVLDEGNVIERGTHDDLVNQGGSYAKMLELQSGF